MDVRERNNTQNEIQETVIKMDEKRGKNGRFKKGGMGGPGRGKKKTNMPKMPFEDMNEVDLLTSWITQSEPVLYRKISRI